MPRRRASVSDESDGFSASDTSSSEKSSSSDDSGNHRSSQSHRHKRRYQKRRTARENRSKRAKHRKRSRQEGTLAASEDASGQGESVSDSVVSEGESCGEAVAVRTELEHVPELDVKIFEAWDALEAYLKNYSRRTHQVCTLTVNCVTVLDGGCDINFDTPVTDVCLLEQIYSVRACITANTRDQRIKASNWEVCITGQRTGHNHEVGQEIYKIYRESRQVTDNEVRSAVRTLHRAGANRKRILEYITENTSVNPTMKDVHNLVERL
ncbi:hypothetical protein F441_11694 [Phytophthora nicotianae CJ01A1]|uniref:FAR1 domain-containing protein n=1 Tax=Phytophthora nicotianae CJ01A1 TaxID=1317063 RepID=W2WRR8_PHYNI|nr:hypothetical protein F441_11694 [Phytophthora nicotianae CJ01A1]